MFKWYTVEIESLDGTIVDKKRMRKRKLVEFLTNEQKRLKEGMEPMTILYHNGLRLLGNLSFGLCSTTNVYKVANEKF